MKKQLISITLLSSLLLVGCQNNSGAESQEAEQDPVEESVDVSATEEEETDVGEEPEIDEVEYQYKIDPDIFTVVPIDSAEENDEKLVLLTFDDAPYGNALEIADSLDEHDVKAIFFVNSMYMEEEEGFKAIQELHERGFEIGNHTHTHIKLDDYSDEKQRDEIIKTNEMIEEATGESPRFFRAPHGVMTDYSKELLDELGMTWMNWSFGFDWMSEYQDPAALTEITLDNPYLGNGSNILMHDRDWTAAAVPDILDGLIEQGFTIVDPKLIVNKYDVE